jgi:hypothetical protein
MRRINPRIFTLLIFIFLFLAIPVAAEDLTSESVAAQAEPVLINLTDMTDIGEMTALGVQARAYIATVDPGSHGAATHEVVVTFANEKTGIAVKKALVGIKHRRLFGEVSDPVWMNAPKDQPEIFLSPVTLKKRGTYLFIVGSKLEDNKKRQFTFQYSY